MAAVETEAPPLALVGAPDGVGKAEMRGASWTARTAGDATLPKGCQCRVERVEGLTLWLRAE